MVPFFLVPSGHFPTNWTKSLAMSGIRTARVGMCGPFRLLDLSIRSLERCAEDRFRLAGYRARQKPARRLAFQTLCSRQVLLK
jgi:hypothetical protein